MNEPGHEQGFSILDNGPYLTVDLDDGRRYHITMDDKRREMRSAKRAYRNRSGWVNRPVTQGTAEWEQLTKAFNWWAIQPRTPDVETTPCAKI